MRATLATHSRDAALRLIHRLETALSEGPRSELWPELSLSLRPGTYLKFAKIVGVKETMLYTWDDLCRSFKEKMALRVKIKTLSPSTRDRYEAVMREFETFFAGATAQDLAVT